MHYCPLPAQLTTFNRGLFLFYETLLLDPGWLLLRSHATVSLYSDLNEFVLNITNGIMIGSMSLPLRLYPIHLIRIQLHSHVSHIGLGKVSFLSTVYSVFRLPMKNSQRECTSRMAPAFVCKSNQISTECLPTGLIPSDALHSTQEYSIKGKIYEGKHCQAALPPGYDAGTEA